MFICPKDSRSPWLPRLHLLYGTASVHMGAITRSFLGLLWIVVITGCFVLVVHSAYVDILQRIGLCMCVCVCVCVCDCMTVLILLLGSSRVEGIPRRQPSLFTDS